MIVIDHLTEAEKQAYMIADNQLALKANWDELNLHAILGKLDRDLGKAAGFDEQGFEELKAKLAQEIGNTDEDAVPETPEVAVSVLGDLWELPPHWVLCGSAILANDVERVMAGEQADMCFSDPPFNVKYKQRTKTGGH